MAEEKTTTERVWVTFNPPERKRTYHWACGGTEVTKTYENVTKLSVSPSGNHYLETADGSHAIVAPGWNWIDLEIDNWTF